MAVLRAGGGLGVILHGKDRLVLNLDAFIGIIEQADMRCTDIGRQAGFQHFEAVILRGNLDLAGLDIFYRMIGAAVAQMHLARLGTKREG